MRLLSHLVALCLFALVGCTSNNHTAALIRHADDIAIEYPDSALKMLSYINNRDLRSEELQAKHSLVLSYALDKCYIDVDRDTLIRVAYDYYDRSQDTHAKMMSNYLMGRVHFNASEYSTALLYFLNAEEYANEESDNLYLGLIYRNISSVYSSVFSNKEAVVYGEKSLEHFKAYGDKLYVDWAIVDLARFYHNAQDYSKSIVVHNEFLNGIDSDDNPSLCAEAMRNLASSYYAVDSLSQCISLYERVLSLDSTVMVGNDYTLLGMAYVKVGRLANAKDVASKVEKEGERQLIYYRINRSNKDYEDALYAFEQAHDMQNNIVCAISTQDVTSVGVEFFRYRNIIKSQQLYLSYLTIGIVCFLCCVILLVSVIIRYRYRLLKHELDENMALVVDLQGKIVDNEDLLINKQFLIEQLFSSHFETFNRLSDAYYECQGLSDEKLKIHNEVMSIISDIASDPSTIKKMEEFINRYKDGMMVKFHQSFPNCNRLEVNLFMYIVLGFSSRAICVFLNEKIDVVYNRKSRLKQKIQKSSVLGKDDFLEVFN